MLLASLESVLASWARAAAFSLLRTARVSAVLEDALLASPVSPIITAFLPVCVATSAPPITLAAVPSEPVVPILLLVLGISTPIAPLFTPVLLGAVLAPLVSPITCAALPVIIATFVPVSASGLVAGDSEPAISLFALLSGTATSDWAIGVVWETPGLCAHLANPKLVIYACQVKPTPILCLKSRGIAGV